MSGDNSFLGKAVSRFFSMEGLLGRDFDKGLADIKSLAEAEVAPGQGGARCTWGRNGAEQNAVVYDLSGRVVRRFVLGDGINDVRTSPEGTIWVSYFDEGVFGNRGWAGPGPAPIGESGLVQFDGTGNRLRAFDETAAGTDRICDAYAFNLASSDDAWVYFYTEFPIVRVQGGRYQPWTYGDPGASALAVWGRRVALFGDYDNAHRLRILELEAGRAARPLVEATVTLEGAAPGTGVMATGVGRTLYLVEGRRVFALTDW